MIKDANRTLPGKQMTDVQSERGLDVPDRCPVCGTALDAQWPLPPTETACPDCGCLLWYRERTVDGIAILDVFPGRAPEFADIQRLRESLVLSRSVTSVVVNLSQVDFLVSSFVASLLTLHKRVKAADGRLILCGLRPMSREILQCTKLDSVFEIFDAETATSATTCVGVQNHALRRLLANMTETQAKAKSAPVASKVPAVCTPNS